MLGILRHIGCLVLFLSMSGIMIGQNFTATVNRNPVEQGSKFKYVITLEDGKGEVSPPSFDEFPNVYGPSRSQSYQFINGKTSRKTTLTYTLVAPQAKGTYTLEPAVAKVNGKTLKSSPVKLKVVEGSSGGGKRNNRIRNAGKLVARVLVNKRETYRGEAFTATYVLYSRYSNLQIRENEFPSIDGSWSEEIEMKNKGWENQLKVINGKKYRMAILRKEILYPQRSGKLEIGPMKLTCVVNRGFFSNGETIKVKSPPVTINVKPLPSGAPESFNGAVGKFKMNVGVSDHKVKTNESINMTVEITGEGNLKMLSEPRPDLPPDMEVYDPEVKDNIHVGGSGVSGSRVYEYLIVPRHAGTYEIPPVKFSYFDPDKEQYYTHASKVTSLEVEKGEGEESTKSLSMVKKEDVKILDEEIRYIKTDDPQIKRKEHYFFGSGWYWSGIVLPPLLSLALIVLLKRREKEQQNVGLQKQKKAEKVARKRLKEAEKHLKEQETKRFYEATFKAINGYLEDRLGLPPVDLTKENIQSALLKRNVDQQLTDQLIQTLERCEMARFAPLTDLKEEEVHEETVKVISQLETKLK